MSFVRLVACDGVGFRVTQKLAKRSEKLKTEIESLPVPTNAEDTPQIEIRRIRSEILRHILNWLHHHQNDPPFTANNNIERDGRGDAETGQWDRDYLAKMDSGTVMEVLLAAEYFEIKGLLDLTCQATAAKINGKTPDEIREAFKIKKDFKGDEEEIIRAENRWCEEH